MAAKKSFHRYFVALDLEMNQPSGRIIEVGAVVGDLDSGLVVDSMRIVVNPQEVISPFITELTGISDQDVATGTTVTAAYLALKELCQKWGACRTLYTWGGGDSAELRQQVERESPGIFQARLQNQSPIKPTREGSKPARENPDAPTDKDGALENPNYFFFGHRWEDMKTVYKMWAAANDVIGKAGLEKALTRLGMSFEGTPHRALDDAFNTWRMLVFFKKLMEDPKAMPGIGRRPLNKVETLEQKRREKIAATALAMEGEDLSAVTLHLGPRPPPPPEGDIRAFNTLMAWGEKACKIVRDKRRQEHRAKTYDPQTPKKPE